MERLKALIQEVQYGSDFWSPEAFHNYLIILGRGEEVLLRKAHYPSKIALSHDWHVTFRDMAVQTVKDSRERMAIIGHKNDDKVYLPTFYIKGSNGHIASKLIAEGKADAKAKHGIQGEIGSLHTHPLDYPGQSTRPFFSPTDLFNHLYPNKAHMLVSGVIQGDQYIFAFSSRETLQTLVPEIMTHQGFTDYWVQKQYQDTFGSFSSMIFPSIDKALNGSELNRVIAERHHLVLYHGKVGKPMYRHYP